MTVAVLKRGAKSLVEIHFLNLDSSSVISPMLSMSILTPVPNSHSQYDLEGKGTALLMGLLQKIALEIVPCVDWSSTLNIIMILVLAIAKLCAGPLYICFTLRFEC
jgi:hypothetical protein